MEAKAVVSSTALALSIAMTPGAVYAADYREPRGAVYAMTNTPLANSVLVFKRRNNGTLDWPASFATGGSGTGTGLGNQGALTIDAANRCLYAANAASDDVTAFEVSANGLTWVQRIGAGGRRPISIAVDRGLLYVLNAGGAVGSFDSISGFRVGEDCSLSPIAASTRRLSAANTAPAQVGFTPDGRHLIVTEKATNLIDTYAIRADGTTQDARIQPSAGTTPFGFSFGRRDLLLVSEAQAGAPDAGSVSSYRVAEDGALTLITRSAGTTESATCWVAVSTDGRFAYVTNTGSESISALNVGFLGNLALRDDGGKSGNTGPGSAPIDLALSNDGLNLYALDNALGSISAFRVNERTGALDALEQVFNLPRGANGIVAR